MRGRFKLLAGVLTAVVVLAVGFTSVAFAADPEAADDPANPWGARLGPRCEACTEAVSELLGLSPEEILELRSEGQSMVEIAAAQGVDEQTLTETILAARGEALQQKVEDGTLTQEQADCILERVQERISNVLNGSAWGPPGFGHGIGHRQLGLRAGLGMMRNECFGQGFSEEGLQQKVEEGTLTQEQADCILERIQNGPGAGIGKMRQMHDGQRGPGAGPGKMYRWGSGQQ